MVVWEFILETGSPGLRTLDQYFLERSSLHNIMPLFLTYLVMGAAGFVGSIGLVHTYGAGQGLIAETVKLSAAIYFFCSYWLWSATWIVQHKITLLAENPASPSDDLLQIFAASDALWSLAGWGSFGPGIVLYAGAAWLLSRGARMLPRAAAGLMAALAVSQFLSFLFVGLRGFGVTNVEGAGFDFAFLNDILFTVGRILAFLFAAAALYTEKGIFVRSRRG